MIEWFKVDEAFERGFKLDYPVIVNIFCFKGDQNILGCCLDSILTVFDRNAVEFYIMDDGSNPMDEDFVKTLEKSYPTLHYEKTSFRRNFNLNGRECIINQLKKYIEHAGDRDDALNIKIDPDTIVTKRAVFDEVYNAPDVYYAAPDRVQSYFSGALYAFRNKPLKKALEIAQIMNIPEDKGPEDYLIGLAICAGASPHYSMCIPKWNDKANEGYFSGWDYGIKPENLEKEVKWFYDTFHIITYGNWWVWKDKGITLDDRPTAARRMLAYMEGQKSAVEREMRKNNHVVQMEGSDLDDAYENGFKLDYPVVVNIFSSKDDEDILDVAVQNMLSLFSKNPLEVYVVDDEGNPMSSETVERLKSLSSSVVYETSSFKRDAKLSGKESIVGMLGKFIEHAKGRDEVLNIKIDANTVVCHKDIFDEFYNSKNTSLAAIDKFGGIFFEVLYMFRTRPLEKALKIAEIMDIPEKCGEHDAFMRLCLGSGSVPDKSLVIKIWDNDTETGSVCGWNFNNTDIDAYLKWYYDMFEFITYADWKINEDSKKEDRILPARKMMEYVKGQNEK